MMPRPRALRCFVVPKRRCHRHNTPKSILFVSSPSSPLLFSTTTSQSPKSPSKSSSWERSAKLVKNTDITNPYLDRVRSEVVDPALQIKTIEDELCGAIGKALGKQGEKVLFAIREMQEEHSRYIDSINNAAHDDAIQSAIRYNKARKRGINARWELLVHRQAVGFTVDNHSVVHKTFPIGEALPVEMDKIIAMDSSDGDASNKTDSSSSAKTNKSWGDQLSWWQSVGRWR